MSGDITEEIERKTEELSPSSRYVARAAIAEIKRLRSAFEVESELVLSCQTEIKRLHTRIDGMEEPDRDMTKLIDALRARVAELERHLATYTPSLPSEENNKFRDVIRKFHAILRHKSISPPMNPGVQESMEKEVALLLGKD